MTIIEAKTRLKELQSEESIEWLKMQEQEEIQMRVSERWHQIMPQIRELEAFIKFSEQDSK